MYKQTIPAVSIVIPMYNAEKYIGECLDSILAQTFTDFEVIVVDDCSTDNSCEVVESYLTKFNGGGVKLQLIRRKINSGGGGFPRNIGIKLSRGEYISFLDADDMITKTALEELYPIAKKFDADVVHCEKYFEIKNGKTTLYSYQRGKFVTEPTLLTDNLAERVKNLYEKRFLWNLWTKLIRRDFIIKNDLKLANAKSYDVIFTTCLVCSAEKYIRVPNAVNIYRFLEDSMSHKKDDVPKTLKKWVNALLEGFNYIDDFLKTREFFQKRPDVKNVALEVWVRECCGYLQDIYAQIPSWKLDPLIRHELAGVKDNAALTAFLFSRMNVFNVQMSRQNQMLYQMNAHIQKQNQVIKQLQAQIQQLKS